MFPGTPETDADLPPRNGPILLYLRPLYKLSLNRSLALISVIPTKSNIVILNKCLFKRINPPPRIIGKKIPPIVCMISVFLQHIKKKVLNFIII